MGKTRATIFFNVKESEDSQIPSISVQEAFVAISAASAVGVLTMTSTDYLYPGTLAWVCKDDGSARARVKVLAIISETTLAVRRFANDNENAPPSYGVSDMSAFNGASHICMEAQNAPIDPSYRRRVVA